MKKKILVSVLMLFCLSGLFAARILPYFNFDFDDFLLRFSPLVFNDASDGVGEGDIYYNSLKEALYYFDVDLDEKELEKEVLKNDRDALSRYIRQVVENGTPLDEQEAEKRLFNPELAYAVFVSPTLDSPMSYFGHSFMIFYNPEAPFISPCINFYADISRSSGLKRVWDGLASNLTSYYDLMPFYYHYSEYTIRLDRSLIFYKFIMNEGEKSRTVDAFRSLAESSYPNYNFIMNNCSHGFFLSLSRIYKDVEFPLSRPLSPQTTMDFFRKNKMIGEAEFSMPAWMDMIDSRTDKAYIAYYRSLSALDGKFKDRPSFKTMDIHRPSDKFISSKFSTFSFGYEYPGHRMNFFFSPVFNRMGEQNYVSSEIMDIEVLTLNVAFSPESFESFDFGLFKFDFLAPFNTLKKRPSYSASLNIGAKGTTFYADLDTFFGMSLGSSHALWAFGLGNYFSSYDWEYSLTLDSLLFFSHGPFYLKNETRMVLFSTVHDYFHVKNRLSFNWRIIDDLTFNTYYLYDGSHKGGVSLSWNFNIF